MHTSTCVSPRRRKRKKCGAQILASAWRELLPPEKNANSPAANSFPRSSAGWFTSTPSSKKQKTSGRYNAKRQRTRTDGGSQPSAFSTQLKIGPGQRILNQCRGTESGLLRAVRYSLGHS